MRPASTSPRDSRLPTSSLVSLTGGARPTTCASTQPSPQRTSSQSRLTSQRLAGQNTPTSPAPGQRSHRSRPCEPGVAVATPQQPSPVAGPPPAGYAPPGSNGGPPRLAGRVSAGQASQAWPAQASQAWPAQASQAWPGQATSSTGGYPPPGVGGNAARLSPAGAGGPPNAFTPPARSAPAEPVPDSFSFDTPRDPQWFKHAVFYEVLIRGFHDSNNDGTG